MIKILTIVLAIIALQPPTIEYPPESQPIPSPELLFRAMGFLIVEDEPIEYKEGDIIPIDILGVVASGIPITSCNAINRITTTAANSGVATVQVRIAGCSASTYVSSGSAETDLNRLTSKTDGFLDEVHAKRDEVGADQVIMFGNSCNFCGIAWLFSSESTAFAYVCNSCISNFSTEHEAGHNYGMRHDRPNAGGEGAQGFGYGWCGLVNVWRDVLTYPSPCGGNRVPYYSNPNVLFNGLPTGTATANNARMLLEQAPIIANFRDAVVSPTNHLRE